MKKTSLYLVVIAGGSGTRFWPKSTSNRPKQLLHFGSDSKCLLEQTLSRFEGLVPRAQRLIVTTTALQEPILALKTGAEILAEPQGRNTAPCIYWAAKHVAAKDPEAVMLVMPSDHFIAEPDAFLKVVEKATNWAATHDDLVTLGIKPTRPETGYGYLKLGAKGESPTAVSAFVEKPNLENANLFVKSGDYLWNGGMFLFRASVILKAFDEFMPEYAEVWESHGGNPEQAYGHMTATSIDYGVMEKAQNVVTFPLECGWDDIGSWTSLEALAPFLSAQAGENTVTSGELIALDSSRNIIDAPGKFVAALGVDDLILVECGNTILVAKKERAQDIRKLVEAMKTKRPDLI